MTRDQLIADHPLAEYISSQGIKLRGSGRQLTANQCAITAHRTDHWCVSVDTEKQLWYCNDCQRGGSLIDWIMIQDNKTAAQVLEMFGAKPETHTEKRNPQIVATYDYTDESGNLLYQVVRYEPKDFRQRQPDNNGGWRWTMEGATRVLYRLPDVLRATVVAVCEGEKDAETLRRLGHVSTCNVGGAGKWLPAYTQFLKNRQIIVVPDNDKAGREHADLVIESLADHADGIKRLQIPAPYKDVSDWVASFPDQEKAARELSDLIEKTPYAIHPLPVYTMEEMEKKYRPFVRALSERAFDLGKFLPRLRGYSRHLVPGETVLIVADTGVGKTCLLQSLARSANPLPTLFFELELPQELMFERFVQMEIGCFASDVEEEYQNHDVPLWTKYRGLSHILVCPESGLTADQVENYIIRSELKIGRRPVLVCVDYVGLMRSPGSRSRYEAVSDTAERMKVIAKRTNTIVVMAAQISRPQGGIEVGLHDAKDSGSLENSAGLVLGAWRPEPGKIMLKVLKNTKGQSGDLIECDFDGAKMRITQQSVV